MIEPLFQKKNQRVGKLLRDLNMKRLGKNRGTGLPWKKAKISSWWASHLYFGTNTNAKAISRVTEVHFSLKRAKSYILYTIVASLLLFSCWFGVDIVCEKKAEVNKFKTIPFSDPKKIWHGRRDSQHLFFFIKRECLSLQMANSTDISTTSNP